MVSSAFYTLTGRSARNSAERIVPHMGIIMLHTNPCMEAPFLQAADKACGFLRVFLPFVMHGNAYAPHCQARSAYCRCKLQAVLWGYDSAILHKNQKY